MSTMRYEEAPRGRRIRQRSNEGPSVCCQKISVHHPLGGEREREKGKPREGVTQMEGCRMMVILCRGGVATVIHTRKTGFASICLSGQATMQTFIQQAILLKHNDQKLDDSGKKPLKM